MIMETGASDAQATIRAGNVSIDLHKVQGGIDNRRNDDLSWANLIKSIEAGATVNGQPMDKNGMFKLLRPAIEKRIQHPLTKLEYARLNEACPLEGFAETIGEHFNLTKDAPLLDDILKQTETNSITKGAEMSSKEQEDKGEADKKMAMEEWKHLVFSRVIPLARAKNPEMYPTERTDEQVWAMLVNSLCSQSYGKESPFGELAFNRNDKENLLDLKPVEDFATVLAAHLDIEGTTLAANLDFWEQAFIYGLETDKDGVSHIAANREARACDQASKEVPSTRAMREGATFVLSGPALNPGGPPSVHEQAHGEGRAVEMGEDRYGAILDIIGNARRQKGWKHLTDPVPDESAQGHDEVQAR